MKTLISIVLIILAGCSTVSQSTYQVCRVELDSLEHQFIRQGHRLYQCERQEYIDRHLLNEKCK